MEIIIQHLKEELWGLLNKLKFAKCSQTLIPKGWQEGVVFLIAGALPVCLLLSHPMGRTPWVACLNGGHSARGAWWSLTTRGPLGLLLYQMRLLQQSDPAVSVCAMATPQPLWQQHLSQISPTCWGARCWMVSLALLSP